MTPLENEVSHTAADVAAAIAWSRTKVRDRHCNAADDFKYRCIMGQIEKAAPELLEACQLAEQFIALDCDCSENDDDGNPLKELRAAIARAKSPSGEGERMRI